MNVKLYLRYRKQFEERYVISEKRDQGYAIIDPLLKNFRDRELFFKLYSCDKTIHLTLFVSSIDKNKRYFDARNKIGSMIKVNLGQRSMFDKFDYAFDRALKHLIKLQQ